MKGRLDHLINNVVNPKKTERQLYATSINCTPAISGASSRSMATSRSRRERSHQIVVCLARKLWGERFQLVVTTHLDKGHIHNHIAINSVSFVDGLRFHSDAKLYRSIRQRSDELCAEYDLSVIEDPRPGKTRHYAERNAEREGRLTWRAVVKQNVDEAVEKAFTDKQFYANLRAIGYEVKLGKDISVCPPGKGWFVRLARNFGDEYTYEDIARRIRQQLAAASYSDSMVRIS